MKKLFSLLVMAILTLSVMPLVLADGEDATGDIDVEIEGAAPEVFTDITERCWFPNDQTFLTADEYGDDITNAYGEECFEIDVRGDYVFTGELQSLSLRESCLRMHNSQHPHVFFENMK